MIHETSAPAVPHASGPLIGQWNKCSRSPLVPCEIIGNFSLDDGSYNDNATN